MQLCPHRDEHDQCAAHADGQPFPPDLSCRHAGHRRSHYHHLLRVDRRGGSTGTVTLSGNNNGFTGGLNINFGELVAASSTALGSGNASVGSGARLTVNSGVVLTNQTTRTLTLASATASTVNLLGSGVQDTVNALVINRTRQPYGTYGTAGSGATFAQADFQGTGQLLVKPFPPKATKSSSAVTKCGSEYCRRAEQHAETLADKTERLSADI